MKNEDHIHRSAARYELIDGEVYCLASPSYSHQVIAGVILNNFFNWFKGKKCKPLSAPLDITLKKSEDNICVVQPDIVIICDTEAVDEKGRYMGVPSLTVEVLSDSTRKRDMIKKLDLFMQTDVKEYWLVDTANKKIFIYIFENRNIKDCKLYSGIDTARSETYEGIEVALAELFG